MNHVSLPEPDPALTSLIVQQKKIQDKLMKSGKYTAKATSSPISDRLVSRIQW